MVFNVARRAQRTHSAHTAHTQRTPHHNLHTYRGTSLRQADLTSGVAAWAHRQFDFRPVLSAPGRQAALPRSWTACAMLLCKLDTPRCVLCCVVLCYGPYGGVAACWRPGALRAQRPRFTRQWPTSAPIGTSLQKCDGWGNNGLPGPGALGEGGACGVGPGPNPARVRDPAGLGSSSARAQSQTEMLGKQRNALRVQLLPPTTLFACAACPVCLRLRPCLARGRHAASLLLLHPAPPCRPPLHAHSHCPLSLIHRAVALFSLSHSRPGEVASPDSARAMHRV